MTATSGAPTTTQPFTPQYVGPGASGVDSVVLAISNPYTAVGGTAVATRIGLRQQRRGTGCARRLHLE